MQVFKGKFWYNRHVGKRGDSVISKRKSLRHPRVVEIPLHTTNNNHLKIKVNDTVTVGQPLTHKTYGAYATVSGTVKAIEQIDTIYHAFIENDRKDSKYPHLKHFSAQDLIKRYFKTYEPFEAWHIKSFKQLMVPMFSRNEPFVSLDQVALNDSIDIVKETLDGLVKLYKLTCVILLITKDMDTRVLSEFKEPTYQIKVVDITEEDHLYQAINHYFNGALMTESDYNFITLERVFHLYDLMINHHPPVINTIIVSGDSISVPSMIDVRIGTHFKDILELLGGLLETPTPTILLNHLLQDERIESTNFPIELSMHSFHITEAIDRDRYECIACGECNDHCPVGIIPSKILHTMDHHKMVGYLKPSLCIECGLCSFYCPSKIPVMDAVKEAKKIVRGRKL